MMRAAAWAMLALSAAAAALIVVLALAPEARGAEAILPPEERARCQAEGGCAIVTAVWLRAQLQGAFSSGFAAGKESARCLRPTI